MKIRYAFVLVAMALFFAVFLIACQSEGEALKHFEKAPINGMVYDYENSPCSNVIVKLNGKHVIRTDINGRFTFLGMPPGTYGLWFEKQGYESLELAFDFHSRSQVLYVKMMSLKILIQRIEKATTDKHWKEAESLLLRAMIIDRENPTVHYLKATLALYRGEAEEAARILRGIIESGYSDTTILVSLADIYQYRLNDPERAKEYLAAYLYIQEDPEIRKRYEQLGQ